MPSLFSVARPHVTTSPTRFAWAIALVGLLLGGGSVPLLGQEAIVGTFEPNGLGVDWCPATNLIAYDVQVDGGPYTIHVVNPDGSGDRILSQRVPGLPTRTVASPAWYPDGSWLVASVEKQDHPGSSSSATPGWGGYTDLWAIAADGTWCTQLTNTPDDSNHGTIGGHCSRDGHHLVWTEMEAAPDLFDPRQLFGSWVVKVADITLSGGRPQLTNVRIIQPGGVACMNEAYGFSPDSTRVLFASCWNQPSVWTLQIWTAALDGSGLTPVTQDGNYNEHAVYTPDGQHIVWMTNRSSTLGGTDWWMMDPDGSHPTRLTTFNEPGSPQCTGAAQWAGLVTFAPDGSGFLGGVERSLVTVDGWIAQVALPPDGTGTGLSAAYFTQQNLSSDGAHDGPTVTRIDPQVNMDWGWGSPDPTIPAGSFSARWTGTVQPYTTDTYRFTVTSDDGCRLWIDGNLLIDGWTGHSATAVSGSVALSAGKRYPIRLEYFNGGGVGSCQLSWSTARMASTVIPTSQLYPDAGTTTPGTLVSGGRTRTYRLHLPPQAGTQALPLVLALHGAGGSGVQVEEDYNLDTLADTEGFVVVYPDGVDLGNGRAWNSFFGGDPWSQAGIDDVGFLASLVGAISAQTRIDPTRVYACGLSSGAMMCSALAGHRADLFTAIANVNGPFTPNALSVFAPSRPVPALLIGQTADPITPYNGISLFGITLLPFSTTVSTYLQADGLHGIAAVQTSLPDLAPSDGTTVTLARTGPVTGGAAEVDAYTVTGGGHTWPGSLASSYFGWLGAASEDIDAASTIWRFFRRQQLGAPTLAPAVGTDSLAIAAPAGTWLPAPQLTLDALASARSSDGSDGATAGTSSAGCGTGGSAAALLGLCLLSRRRSRRG